MATNFLGLFGLANEDDPLAGMDALAEWAAGLPANDPLSALERIAAALENAGTAQPRVTPARVQALLALDRLAQPIQAAVLDQYGRHLRSEQLRRHLWHASNDFARWFSYAYEHACGALGPGHDRLRSRLPESAIYSRLFHHRGLLARLGLFRYQGWIPGNWKFLHRVYGAALAGGVATQPFALFPAGPAFSAEQEFIQILLLQRVSTGNQTPREVEWAAEFLRRHAPVLKLDDPGGASDGCWIDLGSGEGLLSRRPEAPAGRIRRLDVSPLLMALQGLTAMLQKESVARKGTPGEQRLRAAQLKLGLRLASLWQPQADLQERRGERRADRRSIAAVAGWQPIVAALRAGARDGPLLARRHGYDDAARLGPPAERQEVGPGGQPPAVPAAQQGWQLHDTSDSGMRILSVSEEARRLQAGGLLALREEGDGRWQVGIVRRLRQRTGEVTEVGVETISRNAVPASATPQAARDSGYTVDGVDVGARGAEFPILYLAPHDHGHFDPVHSLVLPAAEFATGRNLALRIDGGQRFIRLIVALEQHEDWVWAGVKFAGGETGG